MRSLRFLLPLSALSFGCFSDPGGSGADGSGGSGESGDSASGESGETGSGEGTAEGSGTEGQEDDEGGVTTDTKFDTLALPDAPPCSGDGGGGGDPEFSYIWIANSEENTISKIDTQTIVEEGRYRTHPGYGSPSRTSVSLSGDVGVANRSGGVAKFYAVEDSCQDQNGQPGIQTSTGKNDVLAWGEDDCRAWFTAMNYASQRPVAWAPGEWDASTCGYDDEKLWTSGANAQVDVLLLDGDTGQIEDMVTIPEIDSGFYGIYGAASDGDGNFWGSQLGIGHLVRVDREDLTYEVWPMPTSGYGMTVDSEGYVWTCSYDAARFDPNSETWQTNQVGGSGGCMADLEGTLWMSGSNNGVVAVDTETLQVVDTVNLPDYVHGVSIDFYGYVWGVSMNTDAYRIEPETKQIDTYSGLTYPYTYSDMTGFALHNAGSPNG
jgi:hypothetical protein